MPQTIRNLQSLLQNLLLATLDLDTFAIANERPQSSFLMQCVVVSQSDAVLSESLAARKLIASPSSTRTFVFIDRTADVEVAARHRRSSRAVHGLMQCTLFPPSLRELNYQYLNHYCIYTYKTKWRVFFMLLAC